jgi:hypothetical protein
VAERYIPEFCELFRQHLDTAGAVRKALALPHWCSLAEPTRFKALTLLAKLLAGVHAGPVSTPQTRGEREE